MLGGLDDCSVDPAYYIEDCRILDKAETCITAQFQILVSALFKSILKLLLPLKSFKI